MSDYIVRATAANSQIRAFAAVTTDMVETARKNHNTSPVATAALGQINHKREVCQVHTSRLSAKHMISAQQTYDCHCDHNKILCNKNTKNHAHTNKKQHKTS